MHHCNIMYPSCDTIYTGVMLNVEITRTNLLLFVCSPVLSHRTNDILIFRKINKPCGLSCAHASKSSSSLFTKSFLYKTVERI